MYRTLPIETLHKLLICDPEKGTLTWRTRPREMFAKEWHWKKWNTRHAGKPALVTSDKVGYLGGKIFGKAFKAHRVIWAMTTGAWPEDEIDHEEHARADNRFSKMDSVTSAQNRKNQPIPKTNTSGVMGVSWSKEKKKWHVTLKVNRKKLFFGYFDDFQEAIAARKAAEIEHGFHPNHGRAA